MSVIYVGSARHDENGKYSGGKVGDNLQKTSTNDTIGEVSIQKMYAHSKGWYILRPTSSSNAESLANAMKLACNNANIGYDQSNRLGVVKYGINTTTKTEADCSSLVRACIKYALKVDVGNFTTSNEVKVLVSSKLFTNIGAYVSQEKTPIYNGDVLVTKSKGHTVIVVSGNPRVIKSTSYYAKYNGTSTSIVTALKSVGETDTSLTHRKLIANANDINNYSGSASQNTQMLRLLKQGLLIKA